jgi:hypothetical protein
MQVTVIDGGGDILAAIERLREQALRGEIDGIAYVTCMRSDADNGQAGWAYREDMQYPYARLIASSHDLTRRIESKADTL